MDPTPAHAGGSGLSVSQRVGPLTLNSRGRGSLRLAPGLSYRLGKWNSGSSAFLLLAILAIGLLVELLRVAVALALVAWLVRWAVFGTKTVLEARRARREADQPA